MREYDAAYYKANRAKVNATNRAYYRANSEAAMERQARNRKANPGVTRAHIHRRRAREAENGVWQIPPGEWGRLVARHRGCCAYCGVEGDNLSMDHVVPVAKGGGHRIGNFVPACQSCNSSKSDKLLIEWKLWKRKAGR